MNTINNLHKAIRLKNENLVVEILKTIKLTDLQYETLLKGINKKVNRRIIVAILNYPFKKKWSLDIQMKKVKYNLPFEQERFFYSDCSPIIYMFQYLGLLEMYKGVRVSKLWKARVEYVSKIFPFTIADINEIFKCFNLSIVSDKWHNIPLRLNEEIILKLLKFQRKYIKDYKIEVDKGVKLSNVSETMKWFLSESLSIAPYFDSIKIFEFVFKYYTFPTKDAHNNFLLDIIKKNDAINLFNKMLEHKDTDPTYKDNSPIYLAVYYDRYEILKRLLQNDKELLKLLA